MKKVVFAIDEEGQFPPSGLIEGIGKVVTESADKIEEAEREEKPFMILTEIEGWFLQFFVVTPDYDTLIVRKMSQDEWLDAFNKMQEKGTYFKREVDSHRSTDDEG